MLPFNLFRKEVFNSRANRGLGSVVLVYPLSNFIIIGIVIFFILGLFIFLFQVNYTRKATVSGVLEPEAGTVKIFTPQTGTLKEKRVQEGQKVHKGDVLFSLVTESGNSDGVITENLIDEKLHDQIVQWHLELENTKKLQQDEQLNQSEQISALATAIAALKGQLRTQQKRLDLSKSVLDRFVSLKNSGFMPELQVQQKNDDVIEQQLRLQELQKSLISDQSELQRLRRTAVESPMRAEIATDQLVRNISQAETNLSRQIASHEWSIIAPCDGEVASLLITEKQTAVAGTQLVSILPTGGALEAVLPVPSHSLGFIKIGQSVRLKIDAFPYQKFGYIRGHVVSISEAPVSFSDYVESVQVRNSGADSEPRYLVKVSLKGQKLYAYGNSQKLRPGMQLHADIELDTRTLFEWLFEPLYDVQKR